MQLVIIGARNTGTSLYLISLAVRRGYSVTVLTAEHDDLGDCFEDSVKVVSLRISTENVIGWIENEFSELLSELLITTAHDLYASVAAQVASHFNSPGPDSVAVSFCVSKKNQIETLKKLGFRKDKSVCFSLGKNPPLSIFELLEFPVVIKPVEGSASHGITKCQSVDEILTHLSHLDDIYISTPELIPNGEILVEQFVEGQEYCVEVFDGIFVGVMKKNKSAGSRFIERGYSSDIELTNHQIDALVSMTEGITASLKLNWGPVHIDCIISGELIHIIEVNPRIAGSFITAIVRDAWGFDIADALLKRLEGKNFEVLRKKEPEKFAQAVFFLNSDPESWVVPNAGQLADSTINLSYAPQIIPERERRAYVYFVVG